METTLASASVGDKVAPIMLHLVKSGPSASDRRQNILNHRRFSTMVEDVSNINPYETADDLIRGSTIDVGDLTSAMGAVGVHDPDSDLDLEDAEMMEDQEDIPDRRVYDQTPPEPDHRVENDDSDSLISDVSLMNATEKQRIQGRYANPISEIDGDDDETYTLEVRAAGPPGSPCTCTGASLTLRPCTPVQDELRKMNTQQLRARLGQRKNRWKGMKVEYEESAREVRGIMDLLSPPDMRHMELEQAQEISVCSYRPALLFLSVPVCAIPERA